MALDMLAIPSISGECERIFSSAKLMLNDRRNRLNPDIIEANECLRNWFGKPNAAAFDGDDKELEDELVGDLLEHEALEDDE